MSTDEPQGQPEGDAGAQADLEALAAQLDTRLHAILSPEQYTVFMNFSERRRAIPDATANMHEMLALRLVNSDAEVRRLRDAIRALLAR